MPDDVSGGIDLGGGDFSSILSQPFQDLFGTGPYLSPGGGDLSTTMPDFNLDSYISPTATTTTGTITPEDITKMMSGYQGDIMNKIRDTTSSFGGPGLSDIQQLKNILQPRQAGVAMPSGSDPNQDLQMKVEEAKRLNPLLLQQQIDMYKKKGDYDTAQKLEQATKLNPILLQQEIDKAKAMGDIETAQKLTLLQKQMELRSQAQQQLFNQLFGAGQGPVLDRIMSSLRGLFSGGFGGLFSGTGFSPLTAKTSTTADILNTMMPASSGQQPAGTVAGARGDVGSAPASQTQMAGGAATSAAPGLSQMQGGVINPSMLTTSGGNTNILEMALGNVGAGGGTSTSPGSNIPIGNIIQAMTSMNAANAQQQRESLSNRFAAMGRSPASTVMADMGNRIAQSQSLANIQGAGDIERLMLPIYQQREQITADMEKAREQMMTNLINTLLSQTLSGTFGLAGNLGV